MLKSNRRRGADKDASPEDGVAPAARAEVALALALSQATPEAAQACPPADKLAAFLEHRLTPRERDDVVVHAAACSACYEVIAEALAMQAMPPAAGPQASLPSPRRPRLALWAAALAGVVAVAVALVLIPVVPTYPGYDLSVGGATSAVRGGAEVVDGPGLNVYRFTRQGSLLIRLRPRVDAERAPRVALYQVAPAPAATLTPLQGYQITVAPSGAVQLQGTIDALGLGVGAHALVVVAVAARSTPPDPQAITAQFKSQLEPSPPPLSEPAPQASSPPPSLPQVRSQRWEAWRIDIVVVP
ncbi:MAG: zf-HC2 domain-containing protein [Pseudomonadota bacterium]